MVRSREKGETSKVRGSQGKGRGRGSMHPSVQKAITKKQTTSRGRGQSISDSDSYAPSRKVSEGNSLSQSE